MVCFPMGSNEEDIPLFLSFLDDIGGILFSFEELVDVGDITHVD